MNFVFFFWDSSNYERNGSSAKLTCRLKYERSGSRAKLTCRPLGVTCSARDPLRSYFDEPQKNEIYFLIKFNHELLIN